MAPKPVGIRADFTPEILRAIADRQLSERGRGKYLLLEAIAAGRVIVDDLPGKERATALRYIREVNNGPGAEVLLNPPAPGRQPERRTDIPATELREAAATLLPGHHRTRILAVATFLETDSAKKASELGISENQVKRLVTLFNKRGLAGLETQTLSDEDESALRSMLDTETNPANRNVLEALIVFATENVTTTGIAKRFGIPTGTFDRHVTKFNGGATYLFADEKKEKAGENVDPEKVKIIGEVLKNAEDAVTRRRCAALIEAYEGLSSQKVADRHGVKRNEIRSWKTEFGAHGILSLFGEKEFIRPADASVWRRLWQLALAEPQGWFRTVIDDAADYYSGRPFSAVVGTDKVRRNALYDFLWQVKLAGFSELERVVAARRAAFKRQTGS
jgi:transposase